MTEWLIKYGQYAAIVTGLLLLASATIDRPKARQKWYARLVYGAAGVFVIYVSIHKMFSR
jgi:hypothetical protein